MGEKALPLPSNLEPFPRTCQYRHPVPSSALFWYSLSTVIFRSLLCRLPWCSSYLRRLLFFFKFGVSCSDWLDAEVQTDQTEYEALQILVVGQGEYSAAEEDGTVLGTEE